MQCRYSKYCLIVQKGKVEEVCSRLAEVAQDRVDELKGLIDLLADFCAGQDDFAADEDEQNLCDVC